MQRWHLWKSASYGVLRSSGSEDYKHKKASGIFFSPCSAVMKGKNVEFIIIYDLKYRVVQCVVRRTEKPAADLKGSTLGPVLAPDGQPGQGAPEQELEIPG